MKKEIELDEDGYLWIWYACANAEIGDDRGYAEKKDAVGFILNFDEEQCQQGMTERRKAVRREKIQDALNRRGFYEDKRNKVYYNLRHITVEFPM